MRLFTFREFHAPALFGWFAETFPWISLFHMDGTGDAICRTNAKLFYTPEERPLVDRVVAWMVHMGFKRVADLYGNRVIFSVPESAPPLTYQRAGNAHATTYVTVDGDVSIDGHVHAVWYDDPAVEPLARKLYLRHGCPADRIREDRHPLPPGPDGKDRVVIIVGGPRSRLTMV